jgi:hypothetical protein
MSLGWAVIARLLRCALAARPRGRLGRAAISFIYRRCWTSAERLGLMEVDASALDALRDEPGGLIVAANHPTMLDALLVVARLPRGVCVMKAELLRNVFLSTARGSPSTSATTSAAAWCATPWRPCAKGNQLVLFPEGTRTVEAPLNRFKPGITLIAHLARVPIQTVVIESFSPYLTKGWPLLKAPPVPVRMRPSPGPTLRGRRRPPRAAAPPRTLSSPRNCVSDGAAMSATHVVVIPSYDTGPIVYDTVRAARAAWSPVGSSSTAVATAPAEGLLALAAGDPACASTCSRATAARERPCCMRSRRQRRAGFTHALTMDADGQHPAELIPTSSPHRQSSRAR